MEGDRLMALYNRIRERHASTMKKLGAGLCRSFEDYKAECARVAEIDWLSERLKEAIDRAERAADGDDDDLPEMKDD